jgi:hypothetical protein
MDVCVETETEIYFKELAHTLWRLASPKSAGWASRIEIKGRVDIAV